MNISLANQTAENFTTSENHAGENMRSVLVKQLLFLYLMCLISSLLAFIRHSYHTTEIPLIRQTAVSVCSTYLILMICLEVWIHSIPIFIRLTFGPISILVAQLIELLLNGTGGAICVMGTAIALLKILTVSHFDWMYNQDPQGRHGCSSTVCSSMVRSSTCLSSTALYFNEKLLKYRAP